MMIEVFAWVTAVLLPTLTTYFREVDRNGRLDAGDVDHCWHCLRGGHCRQAWGTVDVAPRCNRRRTGIACT